MMYGLWWHLRMHKILIFLKTEIQLKHSLRCCPKSKTEQRELVIAENGQIFKFQSAHTAHQKVDAIVTPNNA